MDKFWVATPRKKNKISQLQPCIIRSLTDIVALLTIFLSLKYTEPFYTSNAGIACFFFLEYSFTTSAHGHILLVTLFFAQMSYTLTPRSH